MFFFIQNGASVGTKMFPLSKGLVMFTIFPQYSHLNLRKIWRLRAFDPYKFITPSMVIKILPTAKAGDIAPRHEVEAFCSIN